MNISGINVDVVIYLNNGCYKEAIALNMYKTKEAALLDNFLNK